MINKTINKVAAVLALIFSALFLSYRKGKKDLESENIKEMISSSKKINNLKNAQENLSNDELIAYRHKLHDNESNK